MTNDHPSLADIRRVGQPTEIRSRRTAEHWIAHVYGRRVSPYLSLTAVRLGLSANAVTWVMLAVGWAGALVLVVPGWPWAVLALVLMHAQMVVDAADGEVARWRGTSGPAGVFIDKLAHYSTEALVALALGVRAAGGLSHLGPAAYGWTTLGGLLAVALLLNKAVNDLVLASRAQTGRLPVEDTAAVAAPRAAGLARLRRAARFVPFFRLFHAVELTTVIALAAVVDAVAGGLGATRVVLVALVVAAGLSAFGHVVVVLSSSKLRA